MKSLTHSLFALLVLTGLANAQVAEKRTLTLDGARQVITAAVAFAKSNNAPGGAIAVVDDGGNLMALERLDGTFAAGANISIGKARTAALFKKPTKFFEDVINKGRTAMAAMHENFTPLQGGETHHLKPGDVVVIPPGTPPQFTKVKAPFHYFVVKPISPAAAPIASR